MSRARHRDRRVYLGTHPAIFALLAATRGRDVVRLGRTVLVHGEAAHREVLTHVPLDRLAAGTIGAEAHRLLAADGVLFDQEGAAHRDARRSVADNLGAHGVDQLRPVWTEVLERRLEPLRSGGAVDVVDLTAELAGATTCALLRLDADPHTVARAARGSAAAALRNSLPGWRGRPAAAAAAARRLTDILGGSPVCADPAGAALAAMLAVAAVNTTVAGVPRAVAWCADERLWDHVGDGATRPALVSELLRVVAPVPAVVRVAAAPAEVGGCPVRAGDRMVLVTRHAVGAHVAGPDAGAPASAQTAQLVFGVGPHACPGARLARAQLDDTLRLLAPLRPVVRHARIDRGGALPGWRRLVIRPGGPR
jgi:cytochrome P450